jgi:tripartite-type tricarboxylate transporter receptor subunit TctC
MSGQLLCPFGAAVCLPQPRWGQQPPPTTEESGLASLSFANRIGIFTPKATPKDIVGMLNIAVMSTLADPTIRSRLIDLGAEIPSREQQTPEGFAALQKAAVEKWWPIIKAAGIKVE